MRILEVSASVIPNVGRLVGLVDFLAGRTEDTAGQKRISKEAFITTAQRLGINITNSNLGDLLQQDPLSNLFEPLDPQSKYLVYKGGDQAPAGMPVDRAQDIVAGMAKRANPLA
jgi:hypothetical protein